MPATTPDGGHAEPVLGRREAPIRVLCPPYSPPRRPRFALPHGPLAWRAFAIQAVVLVLIAAFLAWVAATRGRSERAGWLWGAIEAEQERADLGQWKLERDVYQQRVFITAGDAFDRGRTLGRASSFDDAVGFALAPDDIG